MNTSLGKILLADNLRFELEATAKFLELNGYEVVPAATLEEAQHALDHSWVHLAILDIRMVDDSDEHDASGLLLAKDPAYIHIPKIILTGYPTYEAVREALGPLVGDIPAAVNFVAKAEGPTRLLEAIRTAFEKNIHLNRQLTIRWQAGGLSGFPYLNALLAGNLQAASDTDACGELEDLFCKAFAASEHLLINRVLWVRDGRACLEGYAFQGTVEQHFLITYGPRLVIAQEHQLDPKSRLYPAVSELAHTLNYALLRRDVSALGMQPLLPLGEFTAQAAEKQVRLALEDLYGGRLSAWHKTPAPADSVYAKLPLAEAHRQYLQMDTHLPQPLELYRRLHRIAEEAVSRKLASLFSLEGGRLRLRFGGEPATSLPDPLAWLYENSAFPALPPAPASIFGRLDCQTVLVSAEAACLPSDLLSCGAGPQSTDFLELETSLRGQAMGTTNLFSLYDFESQLLTAAALDDPIPPANVEPECRKTLAAVQTIRHQAAAVSGRDMLPYLTGLYFHTLNVFLEYDPQNKLSVHELAAHLHRLVLAGMLCQSIDQRLRTATLEAGGAEPEGQPALVVLANKHAVRLGSKVIPLTPTEHALMLYLYKRQGEICRREDILREVFAIAKPNPQTDKGLLNTNIGRIRSKIETNPSRPLYLLTVQGEGYRLVSRPE